MFEQAACASCRRSGSAHVGLEALRTLAGLVVDTAYIPLNKSGSRPRDDAASDSEHEIRRLVHAAQNDDDATRRHTVDGIKHLADKRETPTPEDRRFRISSDR